MRITEAIKYISFYNGYEEEIEHIVDYLKSNMGDNHFANFPDFLAVFDADNFIRVLWSIGVLMFGDYGTSPRFGWIEDKENALLFFESIKGDDAE